MPPQLVTPGDPGIDLPLIIDGITFSRMPNDIDAVPDPLTEQQRTLDGLSREWAMRPHFDGIANTAPAYTFGVPFNALNGADLMTMDLIYATGGTHRLTLWRYVPTVYTCIAGVQRYYLPRMRKCAAWWNAGMLISGGTIVSPSVFPTIATLKGVPLAVTYAVGPTLITPGAGGIVIARDPDASGDAAGYTGMLLGDVVANGDVLVVWMPPTFEVMMRAPRIRMVGTQEHHVHTFVEV